jgi:hypothetical protein
VPRQVHREKHLHSMGTPQLPAKVRMRREG